MATIYVNSGAVGTNAGTSWTNAYTSLASAVGAAAGDTVLVHKTHAQTSTATFTFTNTTKSNPVKIICVDKDNSDALSTGATFTFTTNNNIGIGGNIKVYGLTLTCSSSTSCPATYAATEGIAEYENCTFAMTAAGLIYPGNNSTRSLVRHLNCSFDLSGASGAGCGIIMQTDGGASLEFIGCTFTARSTQTNFFRVDGNLGVNARWHGCTFSGTVTNMFDIAQSRTFNDVHFEFCTMPTYTNIFDVASQHYRSRVEVRNSIGGTISDPVIGPTMINDYAGTITTSTTKYRDNGASDGYNSYSLVMASNANALESNSFLRSPPLVKKVAAGSYTVTIYVASGTTFQDDELFVELLSPSEAGTPTPTARYQSSRVANLGTPANLTTDGTSTWTGSGVGTKQKISFSIAPSVAGIVVARVFLCKASDTVYVDPALEIA